MSTLIGTNIEFNSETQSYHKIGLRISKKNESLCIENGTDSVPRKVSSNAFFHPNFTATTNNNCDDNAGWSTGNNNFTHILSIHKDVNLTLKQLERLSNLSEDNHNLNDSTAPHEAVLKHAENMILFLYETFENIKQDWIAPGVSVDSFGEIIFEWWNGNKKLTIYVSKDETSYIKVNSPIIDEMEDGIIDLDSNRLLSLIEWLYS